MGDFAQMCVNGQEDAGLGTEDTASGVEQTSKEIIRHTEKLSHS